METAQDARELKTIIDVFADSTNMHIKYVAAAAYAGLSVVLSDVNSNVSSTESRVQIKLKLASSSKIDYNSAGVVTIQESGNYLINGIINISAINPSSVNIYLNKVVSIQESYVLEGVTHSRASYKIENTTDSNPGLRVNNSFTEDTTPSIGFAHGTSFQITDTSVNLTYSNSVYLPKDYKFVIMLSSDADRSHQRYQNRSRFQHINTQTQEI